MSDCFHVAGFYWKNFQLHPAAYNSHRIKLLQLRATLSDEDNVIAKRGTRGGIGLFNPPSINAICLVIPEISRIGKRVKSSAYSKTTGLWVYLQTTMWIASRLIKSMRFNTTWVVYLLLPISPQAQVSNPRGWIMNIYPCNIIHEISHAHCSDVWQVLRLHRAFHWLWSQGCGSIRFLDVGFMTMLRH